VITVACGFYYYLKIVRAMYWHSPANMAAIPVSALSQVAMITLMAGIFWLGIYPKPILEALRVSASDLGGKDTVVVRLR